MATLLRPFLPFLVALALAVPLAGCADRGDDGLAGLVNGEGTDEALTPAPELQFQPDMPALSTGFCKTGNLTLPVPLFGDVRFTGREDRVTEGPLPCTVWNDPASTPQQRENASVTLEITAVSSNGTALPLDREAMSFAYLLLGQWSVYGGVAVTAPQGTWGDAGPYEVNFDALHAPDGSVPGTLAWLRRTPDGYHSSDTI